MSKTLITKTLEYHDRSFPGLDWNEFLKFYNTDFKTKRNTDKSGLWYSVRGKAFIIWISNFKAQRTEEETIWYCQLEISENAPAAGFEQLEDIIEAALRVFNHMKRGA